jgi:hypothetical protein
MAGVIDTYLDDLARHLSHDPALARRVRAEIADHFAEMLGERPSEAEARRAVERMGPARAIAATLAADGADRQADRTWAILLVALVATFIAMRLRTLWLPPVETDGSLAGLAAPLIDRWAFVMAIAAGAGGYWLMRRTAGGGQSPAPLRITGRTMDLVTAALAASVAAGILRIALASDWAAAPLVVAAATTGECVIVGLLLAQSLALRRRVRQAEAAAGA